MKKTWLKKAVCAGLALALAMGLSACGKKDENSGLAKENVYRCQEIELPDLGQDYNIQGTVHKDGMVYMLVQVYHWNDPGFNGDGNNDRDIRLLSMKEDGTDIKTVTLQMPESKKKDTAESETTGVPAVGGGDIAIAVPVPRDMDNVWEYTGYSNYNVGADGGVYAIKNYNYEKYGGSEKYGDLVDDYVSIRKYYLVSWNPDGTFKQETELEGLVSEEEYLYVQSYTVAADGSANILLSGDNAYTMSIDSQGKSSGKTKMPEDVVEVFNRVDRMIDRGDGRFWILYYDEDDWSKEFMVSYDFNTGTLGTPAPLPASFGWTGYNSMAAGVSSDLIFSNSSGLYTYNSGDTEATVKMNYINSDMNISGFESVIELDEKRFMGVFSEAYGEVRAGIFTYVDPADIVDKSVLVLAGSRVDYRMKQRVVEYNRNSEKYRIVIREYDQYNSYDDYDASYKQLNNDIISGKMPDILRTSGLPADNYAAKGLLADINELIQDDAELSKVEFMQNVFDAYSMKGKLYYVIPSFYVQTMIAKTSIVGDRSTWTMKEMQDLMATLPEGTSAFGDMTRDRFFSLLMDYCGSDFVDVAAQKCYFDSEGFIAMMEYAKTLPEELGEDYYGEDYWMNYESRYRENRTILGQLRISNIKNINYFVNGYFGEPVTYIGFPTESGQGSYVLASEGYAISSKCKNKEAAWDFLRYYLTDEYQADLSYELPIQKKYFMEMAKEATKKPFYLDENGERVEYDEHFWMNNESIVLPTLSQEQVDATVALIESIRKKQYQSDDIINIINEDMEAFFKGQKSAQEVVKIIQSRAQIYVEVAE